MKNFRSKMQGFGRFGHSEGSRVSGFEDLGFSGFLGCRVVGNTGDRGSRGNTLVKSLVACREGPK